jgi:hypothetical protein
MAQSRPSIIIHLDSLDVLDKLTPEQSGELFKAIRDYNIGVVPEMSMVVDLVFTQFKNQFDRDIEKYHNVCKRNKENGKKGGRPITQKTQVVNSITQNNPNNLKNKNKSNNKSKSNNKNINIDTFVPNDASIDAVNSVYPNCNINSLIDDFKDQARNRAKPFKDLQSGFRNYVRKGWVKPTQKKNTELSYKEIGEMLSAENDMIESGKMPNQVLNLTKKMRVM